MKVLGIEPRSFAREASVLASRDISLASKLVLDVHIMNVSFPLHLTELAIFF